MPGPERTRVLPIAHPSSVDREGSVGVGVKVEVERRLTVEVAGIEGTDSVVGAGIVAVTKVGVGATSELRVGGTHPVPPKMRKRRLRRRK